MRTTSIIASAEPASLRGHCSGGEVATDFLARLLDVLARRMCSSKARLFLLSRRPQGRILPPVDIKETVAAVTTAKYVDIRWRCPNMQMVSTGKPKASAGAALL